MSSASVRFIRYCVPKGNKGEFLRALSTIHTQWPMLRTSVEGNVNAGGSAVLIRKSVLRAGVSSVMTLLTLAEAT